MVGKEAGMRKAWMLAVLVAVPFSISAQKKDKPLPMPPLEAHERPISNYACLFSEEANTVPGQHNFWNVVVFAEYGKERKRYWTKSLGTFLGTATIATQNSESARTGGAIGVISQNIQFGEAGTKCSEWKVAVHQMIIDAEKANNKR
jgi:hypothetical protein